eukprot:14240-Heterococcus_DN1.PRE.1
MRIPSQTDSKSWNTSALCRLACYMYTSVAKQYAYRYALDSSSSVHVSVRSIAAGTTKCESASAASMPGSELLHCYSAQRLPLKCKCTSCLRCGY